MKKGLLFSFAALVLLLIVLFGCTSKSGGDTVGKVIEQPATSCTDSDGLNYDVKGTTEGCNWKGECGEFTDYCEGENVVEYLCHNNEVSIDTYTQCENGCENGVCKRAMDCTDSDEGRNYFLKGFVIPRAGDEQVWDSCKNNKVLLEGTCDEQGGKVYEYECPGACSDGACVCSDSDNGRDYSTKGLVIARAGDEQVWDSCKTDYILLEGTCDEQGGAAYEYQCPNGCLDGACKAESPNTCSDSDAGKDYYSKGYTEGIHAGNEYLWNDECDSSNSYKLIERFCDSENRPHDQYYTCPRGCSNGVCLSECSDSDGGKNYFLKGTVVTSDETFTDTCKGKILKEGTCDERGGKVYDYECPGACSNGACVCSDSDNGKDYYTKGLVIARAGDEQVWDSCKTEKILLERTCDEQGGAAYEYECLNGCSEGVCLKFEPSEEIGPIDLPEEIQEEDKSSICKGCEKDGKCYPFNYRKGKEYCSIEQEFIPQLKAESSCGNNFECESNLCINSQCVSGSLWQKFINWLKRIFG